MLTFRSVASSFTQIFFPHNCAGCGSDLLIQNQLLCLHCYSELPYTHYEIHDGNPVERMFWGRMPVSAATATFYFSKASVIQHLIHDLKYKNKQDIGVFLGQQMGLRLIESYRFMEIDALIPLPLFADKQYMRGYNQAEILCKGMSDVMHLPVLAGNVIRKHATETQTKKGRTSRWENVSDSFMIKDPASLQGMHLLLVDDVITTGATIEACAAKIIEAGCTVSVATVAVATK